MARLLPSSNDDAFGEELWAQFKTGQSYELVERMMALWELVLRLAISMIMTFGPRMKRKRSSSSKAAHSILAAEPGESLCIYRNRDCRLRALTFLPWP